MILGLISIVVVSYYLVGLDVPLPVKQDLNGLE